MPPMSHSASPSRPYLKLDEPTEQLQTRLLRLVGETIREYGLITDGEDHGVPVRRER